MHIKMTTNEMAKELANDENAAWTYEGARALAEWLEDFEESTGQPMEFDPVALRCEFSEYASDDEALAEYELSTLKRLRDETIVIDVPGGGVIVQDF